jgi:hypothetical protein
MKTLDLKKTLKYLYMPSAKEPVLVEVPEMQFAMVTGRIRSGETPGTSPAFQQAMEALYGISYTLKFASRLRKEDPIDYPVMALEALWWVEDGQFDIRKPGNWYWQAMMMQPDPITPEMYADALAQLRKKKPGPALDLLRFERFHEGLCVQIMHIGPYATETATVERMEAFARQGGYVMHHRHHEIYLGDPRRAAPEKLKTVLRHPVRKA